MSEQDFISLITHFKLVFANLLVNKVAEGRLDMGEARVLEIAIYFKNNPPDYSIPEDLAYKLTLEDLDEIDFLWKNALRRF
ncbi:MAG: hypothetical protein SGJ15_08805 [Bacteroidota bacterium]|nr:hypothetical protein [Bacteroidota bacterium]